MSPLAALESLWTYDLYRNIEGLPKNALIWTWLVCFKKSIFERPGWNSNYVRVGSGGSVQGRIISLSTRQQSTHVHLFNLILAFSPKSSQNTVGLGSFYSCPFHKETSFLLIVFVFQYLLQISPKKQIYMFFILQYNLSRC